MILQFITALKDQGLTGNIFTLGKQLSKSTDAAEGLAEATGLTVEQVTNLTKLGPKLLSFAKSFGAVMAVYATVYAVSKAWDYFNTTVDETQERIDGVNSKITELNEQIKELESIGYRNEAQNNRLNALQRELELQESLLAIEQKRYYQELTGNKFTDKFDSDNLYTKYYQEAPYLTGDFAEQSEVGMIKQRYSVNEHKIAEYDEKIASTTNDNKKAKLIEKRNKLLETQVDLAGQLAEKEVEYLDYYTQAQEAVDSGQLYGSDLEDAKELASLWKAAYEDISSISTEIQKTNGTFDYSAQIAGILGKVDYKDLKDPLIELAKNGDLSVNLLETEYTALTEALDAAGIEASELYYYLLNLADPQMAQRTKDIAALNTRVGIDSNIDSASEAQAHSLLYNAGAYTDEGLTAWATIQTEIDTSNWTVEDIAAAIQEKLDGQVIAPEINVTPTITSSVQEIAKQLEPQMSALEEVYNSIFNGEGGFNADIIDHSMMANLEASFNQLEEDLGVTFDSQALEDFFRVLGDGVYTADEAQNAFNDLATAWFYSTDVLDHLNKETAGAITQQLELMGVTNAAEVVQTQLNNITAEKKFAAQAGKELADATYDEVNAFIVEEIALGNADKSLYTYYLTKLAVNGATVNTLEDCRNILALADAAGISGEALKRLAELMNAYDQQMKLGNYTGAAVIASEINGFKSQINAEIANFKPVEINWSPVVDSAGKAGQDAGEELKDQLEQELNDLDSVISSVTNIIGDKIDDLQNQMDAAIDALEAERDAAIEALEDEKKALEDAVKAKQDQIDAIREAREERSAELDLQRKEYELERLQNQRTLLIYSDSKGFHYENDSKEVRDAKEAVDEAKEEIKILKIEKEISALEDSIDNIDDKIEEVNDHYDKLIEQTEQYWQSLINNLEAYKSRWEELAELKEQAEFQRQLEELGLSSVDILNMSEEAFQSFKTQYSEALNAYLAASGATEEELANMAGSVDKLGSSSSTASSGIKSAATATKELKDSTQGIADEVSNTASAIGELNSVNLDVLTSVFDNLALSIKSISDAIGTVTDGGTEGLLNSLSSLNTINLGGDGEGIIDKFIALKDAVFQVSAAITGGAGAADTSMKPADRGFPSSTGQSTTSGSDGSAGLIGAIEEQGQIAETVLSEEIPKFNGEEESLLGAVTDVTTAIAGSGDEGTESEGVGEGSFDTSTLVGAIGYEGEVSTQVLEAEVKWFEDLEESITNCVTALENLVTKFAELPAGLSEGFSIPFATGTVGKAFAKGTGNYKGLAHDEKNALRSEYGQPELTVYPDGTTELTTEPTMSDLPKDTVIFNAEQTKRIMNNQGTVLGKAHAEGTLPAGLIPLEAVDPAKYKMLSGSSLVKLTGVALEKAFDKQNSVLTETVNQALNLRTNTPAKAPIHMGDIQFICNGITADQVEKQISGHFEGLFTDAYQKSMTRQ